MPASAKATRWTPYIPHLPTTKQAEFLRIDGPEALYGGAAGGGKSDALLMAALLYAHVRGYAALLLRRSYGDLALPGALMDRARSWLIGTDATWHDRDKRWDFPSGASLTFGYLEHSNDRYRYQSSEFQFIGFDELTQFREDDYLYLFSRIRRRTSVTVPLRMRGATNPGGEGHDWVKQRFIAQGAQAPFVPAKLSDNVHVDQAAYLESLSHLDGVTRAQLEEGNWDVLPQGFLFKREWFAGHIVDAAPAVATRVRYWDKAGTEDGGAYTVGVRMAKTADGRYVVEDVVRGQWSSLQREAVIKQTAAEDGHGVAAWVEQEPGSGGKESAEATIRMLGGYDIHAERVTGDKVTRARPFSAQCEAGNVLILRSAWNSTYLNELVSFPDGPYKDQVDASSGAFNKLAILRTFAAAAGGQRALVAGYRVR